VEQQVCSLATFDTLLDSLYWGLAGNYPFGYLFWNLLLAFCVIFYLQFAPLILGWILTKTLNRMFLDPKDQVLKIGEVAVMLLGGRLALRNLEYISPNVHVKCLEVSLSMRWWLGAQDIRQGPLPNKLLTPSAWKALPFRMNIAFIGLDVSVYNNTGRYGGLEDFILRGLFREKFKMEPPLDVDGKPAAGAGGGKGADTQNAWESVRSFWAPLNEKNKKVASANSSDEHSPRMSHGRPLVQNREPLPRFYNLFPITHILFNETVIYLGAPTLPSTMIACITRAAGHHYAESISIEAPNHELDSYCVVNSFDMRGVTVTLKPNPGYVAEDELQSIRARLEMEVSPGRARHAYIPL